jgi:antirestriction protein ArdC
MDHLPTNSREIAATITDTIIARLDAGTLPWRRGWSLTGEGGRPLRHEGTPYTGINTLWLWATAEERGYRSRYWMTRRQAEELGGRVNRTARASISVYASTFRKAGQPTLSGEPAAALIRFLRSYLVFNADEIEDLPAYYYARDVPPTPLALSQRQSAIDAFFAAIPAIVRHGGDQAYFNPGSDHIQLPRPGAFRSADAYASTRGHELTHWTGHRTRLARDFSGAFGSQSYAREELVAEMGSAFVCAALGIVPTVRHADYLASWLEVLREDNRAIFRAASAASKAADFLLAFPHEMAVEGRAAA